MGFNCQVMYCNVVLAIFTSKLAAYLPLIASIIQEISEVDWVNIIVDKTNGSTLHNFITCYVYLPKRL